MSPCPRHRLLQYCPLYIAAHDADGLGCIRCEIRDHWMMRQRAALVPLGLEVEG